MLVTIVQFKRLAVLINRKTLIEAEATLEQTAVEMRAFHLQVNDSDHIMSFNHK